MTQASYGTRAGNLPHVDVNTAIVNPIDRVRWGPIWAGIFSALATLAVLSVLGLAIGLSVYDRNDPGRAYGIGAGVWGVISYLIAFAIGGWVAGRTSALAGRRNSLINGAMVWTVAIPLLMFMLGGGLASLVSAGVNAAGDAAAVASNTDDTARTNDMTDRAQTAAARIGDATGARNVSGEDVRRKSAGAAWWTLVALLLGLGAASAGGWFAGSQDDVTGSHDRHVGVGSTGTAGSNVGA
jgi:MFS family permease